MIRYLEVDIRISEWKNYLLAKMDDAIKKLKNGLESIYD
jgi:hypothetical protein